MRLVTLLFILVLASCYHKENRVNDTGITIKQQPPFTFNYAENKLRAKQLYKEYRASSSILHKQKMILFIRDSLLPCWYGTPWDFYGTTEEPGKGSIACGYFVTTVLRDAGLSLNRIKLAQCASEEMIRSVCDPATIHRYSNVPIQEFTDKIKKAGAGLYITGLDNHTGFILNDGEEVYFIHSTYVGKRSVIKEKAIESYVLASSRYRVIGEVNW